MKALLCRRVGVPSDVLQFATVPQPRPKAGEVMIKVSHVALNPIDYKLMGSSLLFGMAKKEGVVIPCEDLAGTVVEAPNCQRVNVGDEVVGFSPVPQCQALAEYAVVPESLVVRRPAALSAAEACSFPLVALTARTALHVLDVRPGNRLLVLGGASATGTYATQIAKRLLGVQAVTVTCSAASSARCQAMGADRTIDYKTQNWWEVLKGEEQFDAVLDTVGGTDQWTHAREVLKSSGHFTTLVGDHPHDPLGLGLIAAAAVKLIGRKLRSVFSGPSYSFVQLKANPQWLRELAQAFDSGDARTRLQPYVHGVLPWTQFPEAFATLMQQQAKGKIVLSIS